MEIKASQKGSEFKTVERLLVVVEVRSVELCRGPPGLAGATSSAGTARAYPLVSEREARAAREPLPTNMPLSRALSRDKWTATLEIYLYEGHSNCGRCAFD